MQRFVYGSVAIFAGLLVAALGCGDSSPPVAGPPKPTFAGTVVTVGCADPAFGTAFAARASGWAGRTGATVKVVATPETADVALIPPSVVGTRAARSELAVVPTNLRGAEHPGLLYGRIAVVYRSLLASWAGEAVGIPVAGDGRVLVYRADLFANPVHATGFSAQFQGRTLAPPSTWDDLAEIATYFAKATNGPTLPPLPADAHNLLDLFFRLAAGFDRLAVSDAGQKGDDRGMTFQYVPDTGICRLTAPAFAAAADWLASTRNLRMPNGSADPVVALDQGAVLAVLTLADVGRLPKDANGAVASRFRVAPLPGSRTYFDASGKRLPAGRQGNFVPYLGSGGWIGVVPTTNANPAAAWDLLADVAGPAVSAALLSDPAAGAGPFRTEHLDPAKESLWLRYGFDAARNREFASAIRSFVGQDVTNPTIALRTPDAAEMNAIIEREVRKAADGKQTGATAMIEAAAAWAERDATRKPDDVLRGRRNAIGLP